MCRVLQEPSTPRQPLPLDSIGQKYNYINNFNTNTSTDTISSSSNIMKNQSQTLTVRLRMLDASSTIVMRLNGSGYCSPSLKLGGSDKFVAGIRMAAGRFYWEVTLGRGIDRRSANIKLGVCTYGFITLRLLR